MSEQEDSAGNAMAGTDTDTKQWTRAPWTRTRKEFYQVRRTGDWSAGSKLCSIENRWWYDPFFRMLNCDIQVIPKRTPLICFGYYVRFRVCDYFIRNLIDSATKPIQIVSLGCGMDSLFFRLLKDHHGETIFSFYDVDYASVIDRKREIIDNNASLLEMSKSQLSLVAADLRYIDQDESNLGVQLEAKGFKFELPTILYSECVVNYLSPSESDNIIRWISQNVARSIYFAYEQTSPNDSFGRIMTAHFEKNGSPISSIYSNGSLEEQRTQLE